MAVNVLSWSSVDIKGSQRRTEIFFSQFGSDASLEVCRSPSRQGLPKHPANEDMGGGGKSHCLAL